MNEREQVKQETVDFIKEQLNQYLTLEEKKARNKQQMENLRISIEAHEIIEKELEGESNVQ